MNYILVQNGQIVGRPRPLPVSWENISNFNVFDNQTVKIMVGTRIDLLKHKKMKINITMVVILLLKKLKLLNTKKSVIKPNKKSQKK